MMGRVLGERSVTIENIQEFVENLAVYSFICINGIGHHLHFHSAIFGRSVVVELRMVRGGLVLILYNWEI